MREWLRTLLALKSIVLGLLILGSWGRSYFVGDQFRRGGEGGAQYVQLGSAGGSVVVSFRHDGKATDFRGSWAHVKSKEPKEMLSEAQLGDSPWNRIGFGFSKEVIQSPGPGMIVNVIVPHWLMFLLAIPSAVRWFIRRWLRGDDAAAAEGPLVYECPRCGQMFLHVPHTCPICNQSLAAAKFR